MFHTFEEKKHKSYNSYKKILIIFFVLVLFVFVILGLVHYFDTDTIDYQNLLENQDFDIVYSSSNTIVKEEDRVPVININHPNVSEINAEIMEIYQEYLTKFTDEFEYDFDVSGHVLSLLIRSKQRYVDASNYDIHYQTYNLDLETLEVLSDQDLFEMFDIKEDDLRYFITYKFLNYYNDLVDEGYFTEDECDFQCFIDSKGIVDFMEDNSYYIHDGRLELYKSFNIYSPYHEENYFTEESFHFVVKE